MSDLRTFRPHLFGILLLFWLIFISFAFEAIAMDMRAGRTVTISAGEVVAGNLYVAGGEIFLSGKVDGDLVAGGGTITLDGTVTHDITIGGGQIIVSGQVGGDLRVAGGQVVLSGKLNGDLVAAAGTVRVLSGAIVGGDVVLAGGNVLLEGTLVRSVKAVAGRIAINGTVTGPVEVRAGELTIGERGNLGNELTYFSPEEADISDQAKVAGPVTFHVTSGMDQDWLRVILRRLGVAFFLLRFLMTLGAGIVGFVLLRKPSQELVRYALTNFGREFLRGFVLFFVIPPAIFLIFITVVGVPVAFLGGLLHLSVGMIAIIYSGIALGALTLKWLRHQAEYTVGWLAVLVGIPLAFLLRLVPYIGFLCNATFFLAVFGALYQRFWLIVRRASAPAPQT